VSKVECLKVERKDEEIIDEEMKDRKSSHELTPISQITELTIKQFHNQPITHNYPPIFSMKNGL
jgi:hypothetical protein